MSNTRNIYRLVAFLVRYDTTSTLKAKSIRSPTYSTPTSPTVASSGTSGSPPISSHLQSNTSSKTVDKSTLDGNPMAQALPRVKGKVTSYSSLVDYTATVEGFSRKPYWDIKQWTNGYGTKAKHKNGDITRTEAKKRLHAHMLGNLQQLKRILVPKAGT